MTVLAVASLVLSVACLAVQVVWARQRKHAGGAAADRSSAVYELAYLAGGAPRVVTTASWVLHQSGTLMIGADGIRTTSQEAGSDPVEAAITAALRYQAQPVLTAKVFARAVRSKALAALAERLGRQHLLVPPGTRPPSWVRGLAVLAALTGMGATVAVCLTGAGRVLGIAVAGMAAGIASLVLAPRELKAVPTDAGRRVLTAAYTHLRHADLPPGSGRHSSMATRIALEGAAAMPDGQLRHELTRAESNAAAGLGDTRRWRPRVDISKDTGRWSDQQWGDLPQADRWYT